MFLDSSSAAGAKAPGATSFVRFAELVNKTVTSASTSARKRRNAARKKLNRIIKEQQRYAKSADRRALVLTLTYQNSAAFSSKHISAFLDRARRAIKRLGFNLPYAWVLERASHLHYHLIIWLPRGVKFDHGALKRWWPHGSTWVASCRGVGAWGRYMAKFDSIALLPTSARVFGHGGLDESGKTAVSRSVLPRWLLALLPEGHRVRRCVGGGWVNSVTAEVYFSPYVWTPWGAVLAQGSFWPRH
jgi:hypothetical protein